MSPALASLASAVSADFFAAGLKGRYKEAQYDEHKALDGHYHMEVLENGAVVERDIPLRTAMNEVLRDNYVEDCQRAVDRTTSEFIRFR